MKSPSKPNDIDILIDVSEDLADDIRTLRRAIVKRVVKLGTIAALIKNRGGMLPKEVVDELDTAK